MLYIVLTAAIRSVVLALIAGGAFALFRVHHPMVKKAAWASVLAVAFAMPLLGGHLLHISGWKTRIVMDAASLTSTGESTLLPSAPSQEPLPEQAEIVGHEGALQTARDIHSISAPRPSKSIQIVRVLNTVYGLVAVLLLLRILFGCSGALRIWRSAEPYPSLELKGVKLSGKITSPCTFGSGVLLPMEALQWASEDLSLVLAHEQMHVRHGDFYLQMAARIYTALFWFSPLGWWLERECMHLGEQTSDYAALQSAPSAESYAGLLIRFSSGRSPAAMVKMARRSRLRSRIDLIFAEGKLAGYFAAPVRSAMLATLLLPTAVLAATVSPKSQPLMRVQTGALSFAARMISPMEPEPEAPSNTLIALQSARAFQMAEPVKLALAGAAFAQTSKQPPANVDGSRATLQRFLGFEDQSSTSLTGWFANPAATVSADDRVVHSGHWSVRLQRDPQSARAYSVITRSLPVDFQGHVVELRGYLRLQDVSDSAGLWLGEDQNNDGKMIELENMTSQQVKGTRDWAQYRITLPVNPRAQQLHFGVLVSGTGTLWADDLELLMDGKPIAQAPDKQPLTNVDVISMTHAGVAESTILLAIQNMPVKFDVSAQDIVALHAAGVTEPVLNQMLRVAGPQRSGTPFGVLTGSFPVKEAAGKTVRFSAWIKTENVADGYAGLWWRVDGPGEGSNRVLSFNNSMATGTTPWTLYEFEVPVGETASNINFGATFSGTGTAWVDAMKIELDGQPYSNPKFDFDFESPTAKGFYAGCGGVGGCTDYKVRIDNTTSYSGRQSLKMQSAGDTVAQR